MKQLPDSKTLAIVVIFLAISLVLCMIFNSDKSEAQTYWSDTGFGSVPSIIPAPDLNLGQSTYDSARMQDEILKRMLEENQPSQPPAIGNRNAVTICSYITPGSIARRDCFNEIK